MSDNSEMNNSFNLHFATIQVVVVLAVAAVFTNCNWTKTFLNIQSWLFLVLRVYAHSKYIWLWLSSDISQQDLMLD